MVESGSYSYLWSDETLTEIILAYLNTDTLQRN